MNLASQQVRARCEETFFIFPGPGFPGRQVRVPALNTSIQFALTHQPYSMPGKKSSLKLLPQSKSTQEMSIKCRKSPALYIK